MAGISSVGQTSQSQTQNSTDAINDLDLGTFLKLLITEMQNQDPLNPLDNKDMLAQISQLREVGATDKLTATLDSVLLGQNIASSTNLIGAEIDALSDDQQFVTGVVKEVSIENGQPKLRLDLDSGAEPSIEGGDLSKGTYSYRVVWKDDQGRMVGIDLSGANAVSTIDPNGLSDYKSVTLSNLPESEGPKQVYRTDKTGTGEFRLVTTIPDGKQSTFHDKTADEARAATRLSIPFGTSSKYRTRTFHVSLNNVAEIRAPKVPADNGNPSVPNPSDGDLNNDGSVDAADYVVWRKQGGSEQDYAEWLKSFGSAT
jgi:flagellar hook assembly protein FlgD